MQKAHSPLTPLVRDTDDLPSVCAAGSVVSNTTVTLNGNDVQFTTFDCNPPSSSSPLSSAFSIGGLTLEQELLGERNVQSMHNEDEVVNPGTTEDLLDISESTIVARTALLAEGLLLDFVQDR